MLLFSYRQDFAVLIYLFIFFLPDLAQEVLILHFIMQGIQLWLAITRDHSVHNAVFKWLSIVVVRLRLKRFEQVTGNHLELWLVHRSALLLLWLVGVITLLFVWRQSFENHSVFIDNDFRLLKLVFAAFRTKRGVASSDKKWPKQGDKVNINYVFGGKK